MSQTREDFAEILKLVRPGARVLDIGCEDGELLELLTREKGVYRRAEEAQAEATTTTPPPHR